MEHKLRMQIKETVREILEESDMETTTEHQIRRLASSKLDLDLDKSEYKAYVRHVVNSFLEEQKAKQEDDEEETGKQEQEYDDEGNLVICRLSAKRKVTIQNFRGANLVSIREYYYDGGAERPTAKGRLFFKFWIFSSSKCLYAALFLFFFNKKKLFCFNFVSLDVGFLH
ncbi:RNA polymerase II TRANSCRIPTIONAL COACTIVATOR [Salix koriyanagi]|uniref:RNA polymerase II TRANSCRIPTIONAL COACTIVATOR n=1 Tax=Salix koriyanagi TaxID=2511006 RepID=A0A9Q0T5M2_9ROSI|nr:RNA polymerase II TRANSCRIPTIONAL COACTIVATOR [Salix koriyanagi]